MDSLADTFKALSDETRLRMISLLLEGEELCVCDFVVALGLTQSKASRHLRYLYHTGLVEDRRSGVWMHYRLARGMTESQRAVLDALRTAMDQEQVNRLRVKLRAWQEQKAEQRQDTSCIALTVKGA